MFNYLNSNVALLLLSTAKCQAKNLSIRYSKVSLPISKEQKIDVYYVIQFHSKGWLSLINIKRHKFILQEKVEVSTWHLSYKLASFYLQLYNIFLKSYNSEQKYILEDQLIFYNDWLITNKKIFSRLWKFVTL